MFPKLPWALIAIETSCSRLQIQNFQLCLGYGTLFFSLETESSLIFLIPFHHYGCWFTKRKSRSFGKCYQSCCVVFAGKKNLRQSRTRSRTPDEIMVYTILYIYIYIYIVDVFSGRYFKVSYLFLWLAVNNQ